MDTNKFTAIVTGLQDLIEDYKACKSLPVKIAIEEMIIGRAELLVKEYRGENSEMSSCNREQSTDTETIPQATEAFEKFTADMDKIVESYESGKVWF